MLVCKLYLFHCTMGIYGSEWSDVDLCLLLLVLFTLHCNEGFGARLQIGTAPKPSFYVSHYWTTWLLSSRHVFHLWEPFLFTFIAVFCLWLSSAFAAWLCLWFRLARNLGLRIRLWYGLCIWLGLGLSITHRISVCHIPEIFVAPFTSTDTRPI